MIYIIDNFLQDNILNSINNYLVDFKEVDTGEKKFWIMESPQDFTSYMIDKISTIENKNIKVEAKIDMGKTEINITSEGDAQRIGKEFASNMSQELNKQLRKMLQDSNLGVASA